jgi:hypothetical protein
MTVRKVIIITALSALLLLWIVVGAVLAVM